MISCSEIRSFFPQRARNERRAVISQSKRSRRQFVGCFLVLLAMLGGSAVWRNAAAGARPGQEPERARIAEGEYVIRESANSGAIGPFGEETYNFHESFTLWRTPRGSYEVEGVRSFESPKDEAHSNPFTAELDRDLTVVRIRENTRLRWVRDSGPMSCEFLPKELQCSGGGSDPKREIKVKTQLANPYGLLWPVSPFSFTGLARQIERDPAKPSPVDLVRIEQPSASNPVQATVLEGPLRYLGDQDLQAAGRAWHAHHFSLKVPGMPEFQFWTTPKGLLLALSIQHAHADWAEEGMRLNRFESSLEF